MQQLDNHQHEIEMGAERPRPLIFIDNIFSFFNRRWIKYPLLLMLAFTLTLLVAVSVFFLMVVNGFFAPIPDRDELKSIHHAESTIVYSSDGDELGRYYLVNRLQIEYDQISEHFIDALIATEDARFYSHGGIDIQSMFRVLFKTIILGDRKAGGGSTISQQLAKNLYPRKEYGAWSIAVNKFREMVIAGHIEEFYDKDDILLLYLNTVPFSDNTYGIEVASRRFFGKPAAECEILEAATIIGMLKATSVYNPRTQPDLAVHRRNLVLQRMVQNSYLDPELYDSLYQEPIFLNYTMDDFKEGPATYFRMHLANELTAWALANPKPDGSLYNIYTDGLRVFTTLDKTLQDYAELAVAQHMTALQTDFDNHWKQDTLLQEEELKALYRNTESYRKGRLDGKTDEQLFIEANALRPVVKDVIFGDSLAEWTAMDSLFHFYSRLNSGFLVAEPNTGRVLVWVGGIDFNTYQFDHIKASRQVGSTYKPAVYAAALKQGYEPCDIFYNRLIYYSKFQWAPGNADSKYGGSYTMRRALSQSVNTIAVQMIMRTTTDSVRDISAKLGIQTPIPRFPSIALGAADIPLYDMAKMYATFANRGMNIPFRSIDRIEDSEGNIIADFNAMTHKGNQAIDTMMSDIMTDMLMDAVDKGTGRRLRFRYKLELPIAGKTGTTQGHADGWFIGYTPDIIGGVWVGGADRRIRFRTLNLGQGANMALPVWGLFMQQALQNDNYAHWNSNMFPEPDSLTTAILDCRLAYRSRGVIVLQASDEPKDKAPELNPIQLREIQNTTSLKPERITILRPKPTPKKEEDAQPAPEERPTLLRRIFGRNEGEN